MNGRVALGVTLLAVGVVVLSAQAAGASPGRIIADWWPVLVVGLGAFQWYADRRPTMGSAVVIAVGLILLASTTEVFGQGLGRVGWPLLTIGAGVWVLVGRPVPRRRSAGTGSEATLVAAFSSRKLVHDGAPLATGSVSAFLGKAELDLTGAAVAPGGLRLSVTAAFGGVEVIVPEGWRVTIRGVPIFGGWDDTTRQQPPGNGHAQVEVNALVLFAGLEVRHRERWS